MKLLKAFGYAISIVVGSTVATAGVICLLSLALHMSRAWAIAGFAGAIIAILTYAFYLES